KSSHRTSETHRTLEPERGLRWRSMPRHCKKSGRRTQALRLPSWGAALLRPYQKADYHFLIAGWASQSVDERAGTRRVIPHLRRRIEVEDVRRGETTAGAINREHRVAIDFV